MARHGTKNRADALLAASLAAGATIAEAATAAKVSERTVKRRLADPAFVRLVDQTQDAIIERFVGGAANKLCEALTRLGELIHSTKELVALGACREMITALLRVRGETVLARRLAALESAVNEPDGPTEGAGEGDEEQSHESGLPEGGSEGSDGGSESGEGDPG